MPQDLQIVSPNINVSPITATVNREGHLVIGGCDTVDLADGFGTPLWVIDETTVRRAAQACLVGVADYPQARILYAGKAFLCLAMCHLIRSLGLGLDVVSEGELYTATQAHFPPGLIYLHGNNKSSIEIENALKMQSTKIVVDSESELKLIAEVAGRLGVRAPVMVRLIPGVEPDTHHYIQTGQSTSKFGIPLEFLDRTIAYILEHESTLELVGIHAHIGSQSQEIEPYLEIIDILANCALTVKKKYDVEIRALNVGGGLGIAYTESDIPTPIYDWCRVIAAKVMSSFKQHQLSLPELLLEPGRSIIGTAGLTLYRVGHTKVLPDGTAYLSVDGGMADNPRPVTYQAQYTAYVANRMNASKTEKPRTVVGRYCESGDVIIKDAYLPAESGDLIAVFGTGAYNYSMSSNYNRTCRPACVLVSEGKADLILERESNADLIRNDRVPERLMHN